MNENLNVLRNNLCLIPFEVLKEIEVKNNHILDTCCSIFPPLILKF